MDDGVAAIIGAAIPLALYGFVVAACANILRKAGYSGWYVLGAVLPIVNFVLFFLFAFRRWPIESELLRLRMKCGELDTKDIVVLSDDALRMEMRGDWSKALESYEAVARLSKDEDVANSARISAQRLMDKVRGTR